MRQMGMSRYFSPIRTPKTPEEEAQEREANRQKYLEATAKAKAERERLIRERHERESGRSKQSPRDADTEAQEPEPEMRAIYPRTIGGSHVPEIQERVLHAANEADTTTRAQHEQKMAKLLEGMQHEGVYERTPDDRMLRFIQGMFPAGLGRDIVTDWQRQGKKISFFRKNQQWHMQVDDKTLPVDDFNQILARDTANFERQMAAIKAEME